MYSSSLHELWDYITVLLHLLGLRLPEDPVENEESSAGAGVDHRDMPVPWYYELGKTPGGNPYGWWYGDCLAREELSKYADYTAFFNPSLVDPTNFVLLEMGVVDTHSPFIFKELVLAHLKSQLIGLFVARVGPGFPRGITPFWEEALKDVFTSFTGFVVTRLRSESWFYRQGYDWYDSEYLWIQGTINGITFSGAIEYYWSGGPCNGDWIYSVRDMSEPDYALWVIGQIKGLKWVEFEMKLCTSPISLLTAREFYEQVSVPE